MNTIKYRALLCTIDKGSFSAAALELGYSQPTISHIVGDMEKEYGFPLLIRSRDGVFPTKDAESLVPFMRRIVEYEDNLDEYVGKISGIEKGKLRIGCYSSIAICILPKVMEVFMNEHPGIDVELLVGIHSELESWITEGRTDLVIMAPPVPDNYEYIHLISDPIKALLPPGHDLSKKDSVTAEDISQYPFIMPVAGGQEDVSQVFHKKGAKPIVRFRVNNDNALFAMVSSGLGVSVMSELPVISRPADMKMDVRDFEPKLYRDVGIVLPSRKYAAPSAKIFIDMLVDTVSGQA